MATAETAALSAAPSQTKIVPASGARDTRIDVIRAIALMMIFIDHVPGQVFEHATIKNFGFSDAAEAFVLISGMSVALAYGRRFNSGKQGECAMQLGKRAWKLYVVHILLTAATLAIFAGGAALFSYPMLLKQINIAPVVENLQAGIPALALLGHQLGYNNILPLYSALLLMAPLFLWAEARSPRALLAASIALWLAAGVFRIAPPNMLDDNVWFLNPLSWQLIFVIGLVSVMHVKRGGTISRNPLLIAVAAAYVIVSALWITLQWWHIDISFGLPAVLTGFDKTFLSLPRLLHCLALAYLIVAVAPLSRLLRLPMDHMLAVTGRHALPVFAAGTVLSMIGQVLMIVYDDAPLLGPFFVVAGVSALFALSHYLEAQKVGAREAAGQLAPARSPVAARRGN